MATLTPALPEVGTLVELGEDKTTWTVAAHEGPTTVVLTRRGMAPWTSMDQVMGNGRCPTYGTVTVRFELNADGTGERGEETFAL